MNHFFSRPFGPKAATRSNRRANQRRLAIESLEDRTVLSPLLVTTMADEVNPNDGVLSLREAIAQANIDASNGQSDTIRFAVSLGRATIPLDPNLGQLELTGGNPSARETIDGGGRITVSGGDQVRVFYVSPNTLATIARLTITDGLASEAPDTVVLRCHGGGILNDTAANLTLTNDILLNNTAQGFENAGNGPLDEFRHLGGAAGGAVANVGTLTVTGCTFIGNQALGFNGQQGDNVFPNLGAGRFPGIALGGGIWNWLTGSATVTNSRFIDNLAHGGDMSTGSFAGLANGGAIYNDNDLTVAGSLFYGNRAVGGSNIGLGSNMTDSDSFSGPATGGAISSGTNERLLGFRESAVLNVSQCIFSHNQAQGGNGNFSSVVRQGLASAGSVLGGGIVVFQGVATISQSVLDHNQAIGGNGADGQVGGTAAGGGILFVNFLPGLMGEGVIGAVDGCVLVGNQAIGGTGGAGARGGNALGGGIAAGSFGLSTFPGTVTVTNTLVAGSLAQGGDGGSGGSGGAGQGGGVFNGLGETLTASHTSLLFNKAEGGTGGTGANGGNGLGGGLYNQGTASLTQSLVSFNEAEGGAAGSGGVAGMGQGGGIFNVGSIMIDPLTVFIFGNQPDDCVGC